MAQHVEAGRIQRASRRLIAFVASSVSSETLDHLLDAGGYDVVLIDSMHDAYTQIKEVMPHVVILCMQPEEETIGCQVLSMLNLDRETQHIPVMTHFIAPDQRGAAAAAAEAARFEPRAVLVSMN
jgi:CheY-like chemotaxis protein